MNYSATIAWRTALAHLMTLGHEVAPRGKPTLERPSRQDHIDMRFPVVQSLPRAMNYRFMAAEAYWILSGSSELVGLTPWNSRMAEFSDDGETLFGAYGPPILAQLDHVVSSLLKDECSRQAVLTIWRQNPPATKDTPCTVAMSFMIRNGLLDAHVFMRSNDVWLGWVYDVFNFCMVAHLVCCRVNAGQNLDGLSLVGPISPGTLYLTAASSHLYKEHWEGAQQCATESGAWTGASPTPVELYIDEQALMTRLRDLRDTSPGHPLRWWE